VAIIDNSDLAADSMLLRNEDDKQSVPSKILFETAQKKQVEKRHAQV
jgi:hypothetical protein